MIRRFNSLIKGQKLGGPAEFAEHVSLRPTRSVDSASIILQTHNTALDPLHPAAARDNLSIPRLGSGQLFRSSGGGGGNLNPNGSYSNHGGDHHGEDSIEGEEDTHARSALISRVPEERSWKDGYEYGRLDLESPSTPPERFDSVEKQQEKPEFHTIDLRGTSDGEPQTSNHSSGEEAAAAAAVAESELKANSKNEAGGDSFTFPTTHIIIPPERGRSQDLTGTGISRASSNAISAVTEAGGGNSHLANGDTAIDIPDAHASSAVDLEALRKSLAAGGPQRTISTFSTDSMTDCCRICQQKTLEEPVIELGCACRGDLAKAHRSCIEIWFRNKGTNKCEVCQHEATNIPAPSSQPMPHFWVWRLGGPYSATQTQGQTVPVGGHRVGIYSAQIAIRPVLLNLIKRHPYIPVLWILLLASMTYLFVIAINTSSMGYAAMPIGFLFALVILVAGLLFDVFISIFLGASALPVNIIIGVLVVLGLGTAARLVLECWHERSVRENIRRMELTPIFEDQPATPQNLQPQNVQLMR